MCCQEDVIPYGAVLTHGSFFHLLSNAMASLAPTCMQVFTVPYSWSFPVNLPDQFFGIFSSGTLISDDPTVPWAEEIEQKVFLPPPIGEPSIHAYTYTYAFPHFRMHLHIHMRDLCQGGIL